jgi:hypothetical protein
MSWCLDFAFSRQFARLVAATYIHTSGTNMNGSVKAFLRCTISAEYLALTPDDKEIIESAVLIIESAAKPLSACLL